MKLVGITKYMKNEKGTDYPQLVSLVFMINNRYYMCKTTLNAYIFCNRVIRVPYFSKNERNKFVTTTWDPDKNKYEVCLENLKIIDIQRLSEVGNKKVMGILYPDNELSFGTKEFLYEKNSERLMINDTDSVDEVLRKLCVYKEIAPYENVLIYMNKLRENKKFSSQIIKELENIEFQIADRDRAKTKVLTRQFY